MKDHFQADTKAKEEQLRDCFETHATMQQAELWEGFERLKKQYGGVGTSLTAAIEQHFEGRTVQLKAE